MNDSVKIQITDREWLELDKDKRDKILVLMEKYGYDTEGLRGLEEENKEFGIEDIFKQFYGDEE